MDFLDVGELTPNGLSGCRGLTPNGLSGCSVPAP